MKSYLVNLAVAFDQLVNALLLGFPDETLSSRAYRTEQDRKILGMILRPVIDTVLWFDPNHCKKSYESELDGKQRPRQL